jgi:O-6-methylguanine DNA methyltransferase
MKTVAAFIALPIATADGEFIARYSATGLAGLNFPQPLSRRSRGDEAQIPTVFGELNRDSSRRLLQKEIRGWHRLTVAALKNILAGRTAGKLPPLDWSGTTQFQQAVWREMLRLKPGRTRSYGEIARLIGRPKAVRAVGGACGANPIPVLVPCHRVLAANRQLGGFGGGLDWKRRLLAREGVVV